MKKIYLTLLPIFLFFFTSFAQVEMVKQINSNVSNSSSNPLGFCQAGDKTFFTATNHFGYELWVTDGTEEGTQMLKDIYAGAVGGIDQMQPQIVYASGKVFFPANDGVHGRELWMSDGTVEGTVMVKDINPGSAEGRPDKLTEVNGILFFSANDGVNGFELWKSDGTPEGTLMVKDINPGVNSSSPQLFFNSNGTLYFAASNGVTGLELWKSDGTEEGTVLVKDIYPGSPNGFPVIRATVNGLIFFRAETSSGYGLWVSDGTEEGTILLRNGNFGGGVEHNDKFIFQGSDYELWISDGTSDGTYLLKDIYPGSTGSFPKNFTALNGEIFFNARDDVYGYELWKTDGTPEGTVMIKDINVGAGDSNPSELVNINETIYFRANDGVNGEELWKTDGTAEGTVMVKNIRPGNSSSPQYLTNANGTLLFRANDGINGAEVWKSNGTEEGTLLVKDINQASSSGLAYFADLNGELFFRANDGVYGIELWKSDGTHEGTQMVKDINPGSGTAFIESITNVDGTLFFSASHPTYGSELWKSDGTETGTVIVKDINPGTGHSSPQMLRNVDGTLFFRANNGVNGIELWKSDGTEAGTIMVKDINPGTGHSSASSLIDVNGMLFFSASNGSNGTELWKSDGTEAGTVMVRDIRSGSSSSSPYLYANVNGTLFFSADNGSNGRELWKSDGTYSGTILVKDINPGGSSSLPSGIGFDNKFLFSANNGVNGNELWISDGTESGTYMLKDIYSGSESSYPSNFVNHNGVVYFSADDGVNGRELWRTDGTFEGTQLVVDVIPGNESSLLSASITSFNGYIYFHTSTGQNSKLWRSDGTEEGTFQVGNVTNGYIGGSLMASDKYLFFVATDHRGEQLWRYKPEPFTQASNIIFSNITSTEVDISWTKGDGESRVVFVKEGEGAISYPEYLQTYSASSNWDSPGDELNNSGYFCVYNGNENSFSLSGLSLNTKYTIQIFEYNGTPGAEQYQWLTAESNPNTFTTLNIRLPQSITLEDIPIKTYGDEDFNPSASASSGLSVKFSSSNPDVAIVENNLVKIVGVGSCTIYADQEGDEDYEPAEQVSKTLTINRKELLATAEDKSRTYGSDNPVLTIAYNGFVNGEDESVITEPIVSTSATATSVVGKYHITLEGGSATNYELTLVNGELEITKASLTATAESKSRTYGADNPVLTIGYVGFVNGEDESAITEPNISTTATATTFVGKYPIELTGGDATNYELTLVNGELEITKASLTATAESKSRTYGADNPMLTIAYTGFVNGEDESAITEPTISTSATATSVVGKYPITLDGGSATNYELTLVNGELDITKASLTATAESKSRTYGADNPVLTIAYNGFVNGEDESVITEPNISTTPTATTFVGKYPIELTGGDATNYELTLVNGELEITKASLIATADDKSRTYGADNPVLTTAYAGFVNDENETAITEPIVSTSATATSVVGKYPITLDGGSATNYELTLVDGELDITKASLTATAESKSRTYGADNPVLTIAYAGFVNDENESAITEPIVSTSATATSVVGKYPITLEGGSATNYELTLVDGELDITKASLTATAESKSRTYGADNPVLTIAYVGFVNDEDESAITEPTVSTSATTTSVVGQYPITLEGGSATNYELTLVDGELDITKAPLTATADDKTRYEGEENPIFTITYLGFVNGEDESLINELPIASTIATVNSQPGEYDITVAGGDDNNYAFTYISGSLTILNTPTYQVTFKVINSSNGALAGVNIEINDETITTDEQGEASIMLSNGTYAYTLTAQGYESINGEVIIENEDSIISVSLIAVSVNYDQESKANVYPNPFSNRLVVNNAINAKRIIIVNIAGQQILSKENINNDQVFIDTSNLPNGVYLVRIIDNSGIQTVKKIVKNNR
ncbi:ELWxxDGT repeat protein [Perlabentimonas gracilis]|uniref:ELWxxDGT repeat protein n=1 Tax=Perlabentimonas gracilis TaxID=2715279 RepID=UPI0014092E0C|nr:ELWxxDGT repeat protein [Perlabentimonas gracilis]NHB67521.1 T9SS type A sorting domain-containing protein [Perlabentimonas gracilis]